jgi:hypothetical protein
MAIGSRASKLKRINGQIKIYTCFLKFDLISSCRRSAFFQLVVQCSAISFVASMQSGWQEGMFSVSLLHVFFGGASLGRI